MNRLPRTAEELNAWLAGKFQVLTGVARSFLEFSIPFTIGESDTYNPGYYSHRIMFLSLALVGRQRDCCEQIASEFLALPITREIWLDQTELLFIRQPFICDKEDSVYRVYGRLAFWRGALNTALRKSYCIKLEGATISRAKVKEED
jgi:hypothetical protein